MILRQAFTFATRSPSLSTATPLRARLYAPFPALNRNYSSFQRQAPLSNITTALKDDGFCVIRGLYTSQQMAKVNTELDPILSATPPGRTASMVKGSGIPEDERVQAYIFGQNTKRVDKLVAHSPTYLSEIIDDDLFHGVCKDFLGATGDYWLNTAQMIELGPGSMDTPIHSDASMWSMLLGLDDVKSPEVLVNFLIAATPTTKQNGATAVLPGSHKLPMSKLLEDFDAPLWKTAIEDMETIELDTGDCLVIGGRIWHKGGKNTTSDEYRRLLSCMVTSSVLTPEEAHPFYIDKEVAKGMSERMKKFLGYRGMASPIGAGFWRTEGGKVTGQFDV